MCASLFVSVCMCARGFKRVCSKFECEVNDYVYEFVCVGLYVRSCVFVCVWAWVYTCEFEI